MSEYLKMYEDYLKNTKKSSENTICSYVNDISAFMLFLNCENCEILTIESSNVNMYVNSLISQGKSNATATRKLAAIRSFYKYLENISLIEVNPVNQISVEKAEKRIPSVLSVEDVDRLLKEPSDNELKGIRDKAMLELLYATGLKTTELISLDLDDVNFSLEHLRCKSGNDIRVIPVYSGAIKVLHRYVKEVRHLFLEDNNEKALFVNVNGNRMTRQGFWKIVKYYSSRLGIDNISPYTLRHSFAVHLLTNGAELKDIQKMLGHSDISSTQVYSRMLENSLCTAYKKFHPKGGN